MDVRRGQAVIIDALFFMLICGAAAGILFWASSAYGEKSYNAYRYMYINDYETSCLSALSKISYDLAPGVRAYWLDELGRYIAGNEFDETHERYGFLVDEWTKFCAQAPIPISLDVYSEEQTPRGNMSAHLFFACPLDPEGTNPKVYWGESIYSIRVVKDGVGEHGTVLDPVYDFIYNDDIVCDDGDCDTPQTNAAFVYGCSDGYSCLSNKPRLEPSYFASNVQRKLCADLVCVMQTKVYY